MGAGVQREACGEMAEQSAVGFIVLTALECQGFDGVAKGAESDCVDVGPFQDTMEHSPDAVG